ncbi:hypothetical protein [Streptomyces sp. NPDC017988]|uniref:hypothetical protein n=1 Tax=Streptomyces sp. NPDC017988 TaxID=3365025 RepID=UPI0037A7D264
METLKSVSGVSFKQEYIQLLQNSPDGQPVPELVLGAPEFYGTLTLTRGLDKSEKFIQWLLDSRDPVKTGWGAPDLSAGDSSGVDETLELVYTSCTPL